MPSNTVNPARGSSSAKTLGTSYYNTILEPEKLSSLFITHPYYKLVSDLCLIWMMGNNFTTRSQTPSTFEDTELWNNITLAKEPTQVSGSVWNAVLSVSDPSAPLFPRVGDIVRDYLGNVAQIVTVYPSNTTPSIDINVPTTSNIITIVPIAGDIWTVESNAYARGAGQPEGIISGVNQFDWYSQIVKETVGADGTELVEKPWISKDSEGNMIETWFKKNQIDTDLRWTIKCALAYMRGKAYDGTFTDKSGDANTNPVFGDRVLTMEGLFTNIERRGLTMHYPTMVSLPFQDSFDAMEKFVVQNFLDMEVMMHFLGIDVYQLYSRGLKLDLVNTGVDYTEQTQMVFNGHLQKGKTINENFKEYTHDGVTHILKRCDMLNYKYGADSTPADATKAHGGAKTAYIVPVGGVTVDRPNGKETLKNISFGWLERDGVSRRIFYGEDGIHATPSRGQYDKLVKWQGGEFIGEYHGMNNAIYISPRA